MSIFANTAETASWRDHLKSLDPPSTPVTLPAGDSLIRTLRYLEIPEEDIPDIISSAPMRGRDNELWWYLERAVWSLVAYMGIPEHPPRFAALRDINDPHHRFFYVHVFIAALPFVLDYHRQLGIPDHVSQATLADLGRNIRVHRKREGIGGLGVAWWLMLHFRGVIYQLGRLQFERASMHENMAKSLRESGADVNDKTPVLSIHIPDFSGPMSPEACDESIRQAREFLPAYFPNEPVEYAVCNSWLLDPQLRKYLKPESNIIRFQNRFHMVDGGWESNLGVMQFVFGKTPEHITSVPQRTSLERAVVKHLDDGGTWYGRGGWFRLQDR